MSRRPSKPKRVRSIRDRKFRRSKPPRSNWPIIGLVGGGALVVATIITLLFLLGGRDAAPEDTPTLTVPLETDQGEGPVEEPTATLELAPTFTPTLEPTPIPTATSTPTPQPCEVLEEVWVRGEPTEQSTGLTQLTAGDEVLVIGEVEGENGSTWYQLTGYQGEAYIQVAVVDCSMP